MTQDMRAGLPGNPDTLEVVEAALAIVRKRGGRATSARRLLLEVLQASSGHSTAEELAAAVQASSPDVNLSTIYRNLDELERLEIVDRTRPGHGPGTYHLASTGHGHLACEKCGSMTEIPAEFFAGMARQVRDSCGFTVEPHRFAVAGLCAACQR